MNVVILTGSLGADPEVKTFQNGGKIANLRVATTTKWKDRQTGEKKERTEWHSVVVGNEGAVGYIQQYAKKGSKVAIHGELRTRKWQDQNGNDRYSTEVVVQGLGSSFEITGQPQGGQSGQQQQRQSNQSSQPPLDDEIPF